MHETRRRRAPANPRPSCERLHRACVYLSPAAFASPQVLACACETTAAAPRAARLGYVMNRKRVCVDELVMESHTSPLRFPRKLGSKANICSGGRHLLV